MSDDRGQGSTERGSLDPGYFDILYADDADPWRFTTSDYERDKYETTLRALPRGRYGDAIEVGCSIGVLSGRLARRCDRLLGVDVAEQALEAARRDNADAANLRFERRLMPGDAPPGTFDLIVLSEVLYYFDRADLGRMAHWARSALRPDGDMVLVHWLGETPDYPLTGDEAAAAFLQAVEPFADIVHSRREASYRLEALHRRP